MKTLTLTQLWATLVAIGAKTIETRSWRTDYRGPLAIHAAKRFPKWAREFTTQPVCYQAVHYPAYPLGFVLATCRLVACVPTEVLDPGDNIFSVSVQRLSDQEIQFGDFSPGRFGWLLEDVKPLAVPVPAKGALGLWEWEAPR